MIDPREANEAEYLTEDSDDALADLEKEFAAKKQRLLEERARKKQKQHHVDVERSPSPERKPQTEYFQKQKDSKRLEKQPEYSKPQPQTLFTTQPKSSFASRLGQEPKKTSIDLSERIFEFEDVPEYATTQTQPGDKDTNTGLELLARRLEKTQLEQLLRGIKILSIRKLLAKVVAPHFEEPRYVNWCFAGMVVFKSPPRHTVNGQKYLQLKVGDFDHSVDVMLFGPAFTRFWKLRPGEIVVILNPRIKRMKGAPLVSVGEDLHSILEVGSAKHFGYCDSATKSGLCKHVVDVSRSRLCSYHEEQKYRGLRMELQGVAARKPGQGQGLMAGARKNGYGDTRRRFTPNSLFRQAHFPGDQQCVQSERNEVFYGGSGFDESEYDGAPLTKKKRNGPEDYEQIRARVKKQQKQELSHKRLLEQLSQLPPARVLALQKLGILPSAEAQGTNGKTDNGHCDTHGKISSKNGPKNVHHPGHASSGTVSHPLRPAPQEGKHFHKTTSGVAAAAVAGPEGQHLHSPGSTKSRMQELQQLSRLKKVSLCRERKKRKPPVPDELEIEFSSSAQKSAYQMLRKPSP